MYRNTEVFNGQQGLNVFRGRSVVSHVKLLSLTLRNSIVGRNVIEFV